jgi:hypothetical protein
MALAEPRRSTSWWLRRIGLVVFDVGAWAFALFVGTALRFELERRDRSWESRSSWPTCSSATRPSRGPCP